MAMFVAAAALMAFQAPVASAEDKDVVIKKTTVIEHTTPVVASDSRLVNFMDYDLNGDGRLDKEESGKMLFKLFDTDGNGIIDNVEYDKRGVMTVVPMEREVMTKVETTDPKKADVVSHTYERYFETTDLTRYDVDGKGIAPKDFTDKSFLEMDTNKDKAINADEWRVAYDAAYADKVEHAPRLNK
jgi:hypothetical protein